MPARRLRLLPRSAKASLLSLAGVLITLLLAGCGLFKASAQIGPDLKPHLGTSVSIPLGKK